METDEIVAMSKVALGVGPSVPSIANSIYPQQQWPPPLRVVVREGAVALTVPEIVSLVQEGIITAAQAAELLGFKS